MKTAVCSFLSLAVLFTATAAQAIGQVEKCQSSKLKAWAKLRSCEHKASAKEVTGGTVTDLDTGLMWQKTDDNGELTDKDNLYSWSAAETAPNGTAFTVFLAGLNDCASNDGAAASGGFAGHCDWRLPQIDELKAILLQPYPCSTNPCINTIAFGPTNASSVYWSATSSANYPSHAWLVYFIEGLPDLNFKSGTFFTAQVRAVRSGL